MSAFADSALPPRHEPHPPTLDLDATTDVHEEHTEDLAPATQDLLPRDSASVATNEPPRPVAIVPATPKREPPELKHEYPLRPTPVTTDRIRPRTRLHTAPTPTSVLRQPDALSMRSTEAASRAPLAPGTVLCDRYLLEQVVGSGGTALVFRARDMSATSDVANSQVALKIARPEITDTARAAQRLKHEFEHARGLDHPNIVRVLDLHEDRGRSFMTMELIEGRPLSHLLRDWTMVSVPLAQKILRGCAAALSYAHSRGIVHGDFKPGNVFVTTSEEVRVFDFGAAAAPLASDSRIPAGTPAYTSPEVLSGAPPARSDDVFSFACVAYELLTGQHPFERLSSLQAREQGRIPPRAWNLSTPQWLSLVAALSWQREQRSEDVDALMASLSTEHVASTPIVAPVHARPEDVMSADLSADLMPKQRSWGFLAFVACALLLTYLASQHRREPPRTSQHTSAQRAQTALPAAPIAAGRLVADEPAAAEAPGHGEPKATGTQATEPPVAEKEQVAAAVKRSATASAPAAATPGRAVPPMSEISFESNSIVTSESSVAAVFLIKRSQPLRGRVRANWSAVSGEADAGIDFASQASGTVEFADGQAQRAIYVPLRNDLLKEDDESFTVRLQSPQGARLGSIAAAKAIIRDDD